MPLASSVIELDPPPRETELFTTCPSCGVVQALAEATVEAGEDSDTVYRCRQGCGPILIVSLHSDVPWEGRGYRTGDWVLRNPRDLFVQPVVMPASPFALA